MGCDGTMQDRVGAGIERLEERFGSFPVNQTTLTVPEPDYETARERADAGAIDVYVRVYDDEGDALHLGDDRDCPVPRCVARSDESLAIAVARTVRRESGVEVSLDEVARVTIAGVNNEADSDAPTVYRLIALLDATYVRGTVENAAWASETPAIPEYV